MKKLNVISGILSLVLAGSILAGCGAKPNATDVTSLPNQITPPSESAGVPTEKSGLLNDDVLKVGMQIGYMPFEYFGDDGTTPIGLDVDLAAEIAKILGVSVQYENTAWEGIFSGLDVDKYDCIISAVTLTPERQQVMEFSKPYIENWQAILVKKGAAPINSIAELAGLKVAVQGSTASDDILKNLIESKQIDCEVLRFEQIYSAFDELTFDRTDAVFTDSSVANSFIAREPDKYEITWLQSTEPDAEAEKFAVAIKKDNTVLLEKVDAALAELEANGKLEALLNSWL